MSGAEAGRLHPCRGQHRPGEADELVIGDRRSQVRARPQPCILPRAADGQAVHRQPQRVERASQLADRLGPVAELGLPCPDFAWRKRCLEAVDHAAKSLEGQIQQPLEPLRGALDEGPRTRVRPVGRGPPLECGIRLRPEDREVGQIRVDDHVPELALAQVVEAQAGITQDGRRTRRLKAAALLDRARPSPRPERRVGEGSASAAGISVVKTVRAPPRR